MQVLSRILTHAVDLARIAGSPHLYSNDRSEIIWTDPDIVKAPVAPRPPMFTWYLGANIGGA